MKNLPDHLQKTEAIDQQLYALCQRLYPICRSITGDGVRETLTILKEYIDLDIVEVPSGKEVFDWVVPQEWNIKDAWVKDSKGNKVIDFKNHNLHILNFSIPFSGKLNLTELKKHLYSLPDQADLIPYRTSYYQKNWGFCITHNQLLALEEDTYEVFIDTSIQDGFLTYGELYIPGEKEEEILLSAHICHPSLANDNLSAISILCHLAQLLQKKKNRFSYRLLFMPGTIGAITWLAVNEAKIKNIHAGLVASLLGDAGDFTYKKTRSGNTETDLIVQHVLRKLELPHQVIDFIPYGYDERQFCSPGIDLAIGNLTRSQYGQYPEYHTSGDNLDLIQPAYLETSFQVYAAIIDAFEKNIYYKNNYPNGEPQLGRRGLYEAIGGDSESKTMQMAMLWILNFSDGHHSLLHISEKSGLPYELILKVSSLLLEKGLISRF